MSRQHDDAVSEAFAWLDSDSDSDSNAASTSRAAISTPVTGRQPGCHATSPAAVDPR